jgi:hypothetical protein
MWVIAAILIILIASAGCFYLGFRYRLIGLIAGTGVVAIASVIGGAIVVTIVPGMTVNLDPQWSDSFSIGLCATMFSFTVGLMGLAAGYVHRSPVSAKPAWSDPAYREPERQ